MSRHCENRHSESRLNATSVSSTYRKDKQTGHSDGLYGLLSCNKYVTGLHFRFPNIYPVKVSLQNDLVFFIDWVGRDLCRSQWERLGGSLTGCSFFHQLCSSCECFSHTMTTARCNNALTGGRGGCPTLRRCPLTCVTPKEALRQKER